MTLPHLEGRAGIGREVYVSPVAWQEPLSRIESKLFAVLLYRKCGLSQV